ncbi:MAG: helix-turn-helix transcriptional regulator [Lachnospiraceae bacterium]
MISYSPLFETMKKKNVSSYRLEKMGFSRATYYSIRKGNSVSTNTIDLLCKLLECNVADVITYIDDDAESLNEIE